MSDGTITITFTPFVAIATDAEHDIRAGYEYPVSDQKFTVEDEEVFLLGHYFVCSMTSEDENVRAGYEYVVFEFDGEDVKVGACCSEHVDASAYNICRLTQRTTCEGLDNRTYHGDDTRCYPSPCQPVGGCCYYREMFGWFCTQLTYAGCDERDGMYLGNGSGCIREIDGPHGPVCEWICDTIPNLGACCIPNEFEPEIYHCDDGLAPWECEDAGGEFMGAGIECCPDGPACADWPCPSAELGACCDAYTGQCSMLPRSACNGSWHSSFHCDNQNPAAGLGCGHLGACCHHRPHPTCEQWCENTSEFVCASSWISPPGQWAGAGTTCASQGYVCTNIWPDMPMCD